MEYKHIKDCWEQIKQAKTKEEVEKLFTEFPRWSGDWEIVIEDDHYVVINTYYDQQYETYENDTEVLDIEVELDEEDLEEPRKSPLARRIEEEFHGDVISAIHFMLEDENNIEDVKILFSLLADEAFEVLTDDDYVALCDNVLNDLDAEFE